MFAGEAHRVDLDRPLSLAIPLRFGGPQPNFFGAPEASARPWSGEGFNGDMRYGGGCNVAEIRLVPHCNGTHTETAGHILDTDYPVFGALTQGLMPAAVISLAVVSEGGGRVITRDALAEAMAGFAPRDVAALVVRTLPNDPAKKSMVYGDADPPPYFTHEAMSELAECAIRHLLVDLPSIDPMHDGGRLANHRIFWNVPPGTHQAAPDTRLDRTITEMIFVDDGIADGLYLLNLQAPAFAAHAVPSHPVIYPLTGGVR